MGVRDVYLKTRKVPDLLWNLYVCRPVAAVVVVAIQNSRITPNQVTLSAVVVAVISAAMIVLLPGYWGLIAAIVVFELSYVLDCVDGMLARLRGIQSMQGHLLDFLMDEIKAFIILGAVAVRLWRDRHDDRFLLLGIVGLVALASGIALTTFIRRPEIAPPKTDGPTPPPSLVKRMVGVIESGAKFLIHYPSYIWLAAATGYMEVYLYPYLAVNLAYAGRTFLGVALRFGR